MMFGIDRPLVSPLQGDERLFWTDTQGDALGCIMTGLSGRTDDGLTTGDR